MFGENLPGVIPSLFWGIITISMLVFIHEAGHFAAARLLGLKVTEFFIGLPGPRISFKRGDTTYGITVVPLGGWVRVPALEGSGPGAELGTMTEEERAEYNSVPAWKRVTVLLAGVFTNLLVAIVILTALFTYTGVPIDHVDPVPGGPAAVAGLPDNARIVDIDGARIHHFGQLVRAVGNHAPGDVVAVTYVAEGGARNTIQVTLGERPSDAEIAAGLDTKLDADEQAEAQDQSLPAGSDDSDEEAGTADVPEAADEADAPDEEPAPAPAHLGVINLPPTFEHRGVWGSFLYSFTYIQLTAEGISRLFSPATFTEAIGDASSVIGISVFAAHTAQAGFQSFITFIALISIALGLMNLLPIPPLDGGKIVYEIIQKVTGKPVPQKVQIGFSMAGFILLFGLMFYLMGQDIFRLITGG